MNDRTGGGLPAALDAIVNATAESVIIFCGSGVSAVAPSLVPSWYQLNASALDELRNLALAQVLSSSSVHAAVTSLNPTDVPLVTFSQVLSDAFAGRHWLGILTALDCDTTNAVHQSLTSLIRNGVCSALVTTNFDTLLERACREAGVDVPAVVPGEASSSVTDGTQPAIYKIHGSVQRPESMIDLLLDKRRGLGADIRRHLAAACRDRHLVVLGFSGDDLAMDADYLGLQASSALPARVTWVLRPGSTLSAGAKAFLGLLTRQGVPVVVECHDLLDLTGTRSPGSAPTRADAKQQLTNHVRGWIADMQVYPPTAALVLAEMLRLRGQDRDAAMVRAEIRLAMPRYECEIPHIAAAPAAWALLGKEERIGELALADLRRAELAMDRLDRFAAASKIEFHRQAVVEQQLLRAAIRQNASIVWLHARNVEAANRFLASAEEILAQTPGPEAVRRTAGIRFRRALHALIDRQLSLAMIALESSIENAVRSGDIQQEAESALLLAMCLRVCDEEPFAVLLDQRATRLGSITTNAQWRLQLDDLINNGTTVLASGMFADPIAAIDRDPLLDDVTSARRSDDPDRVAKALRTVVERDLRQYGGERLGQLLLSLGLTNGASPTSLYQRTMRTLCANDLTGLPDRVQFLLQVTKLGLDLAAGHPAESDSTLQRLRQLGRQFHNQPCYFVPYGYEQGLHVLMAVAGTADNAIRYSPP